MGSSASREEEPPRPTAKVAENEVGATATRANQRNELALSALEVVVNHQLSGLEEENRTLESRLAEAEFRLGEAREACPALFAEPGDRFQHSSNDNETFEPTILVYKGRTIAGGSRKCSQEFCGRDCEKGEHVTEKDWLIFEIEGPDIMNGGFRDVIQAWSLRDHYVYGEDGSYDKTLLCLPPSKVYGCRYEMAYCELCEEVMLATEMEWCDSGMCGPRCTTCLEIHPFHGEGESP
jgi:hypothetical protein